MEMQLVPTTTTSRSSAQSDTGGVKPGERSSYGSSSSTAVADSSKCTTRIAEVSQSAGPELAPVSQSKDGGQDPQVEELAETRQALGVDSEGQHRSVFTEVETIPEERSTDNDVEAESRRIVEIEGTRVVGLSREDETFYRDFTPEQRRAVRNKIDYRLIPVLCTLYLFAQLDRANIANAKIEGLKEDTNLTDSQYNIVLAIFFIPYFILEVPSNLILKSLKRPSRYIAFLVLGWGIVMTCHGWARNFGDLVALRFFLGMFESGFFPAATFLCSQWYQRHELAFRLSLFMAIASASGTFSGLLAAAIARIGRGGDGPEAWRFIFWIEGGVTFLLGVLTPFLLVDTPELSGKWLTPEQIRYLTVMAFIKDGGRRQRGSWFGDKVSELKSIVLNWRNWVFGLLLHNTGACGYGLKFAVPSIIRGLGYSKEKSQLLSAVPYIFGSISALVVSFSSDKASLRSPFVAACMTSIALGFSIMIGVVHTIENPATGVIIGMSFVTSGIFPMAPVGGSWLANNLGNSVRRAIGLAFVMGLGSLGGLTGSFMYREKDSPHFDMAFSISLGLAFVGLLCIGVLVLSYWLENKKRGKMPLEQINRDYSQIQLAEMAEKSPLYRYTL